MDRARDVLKKSYVLKPIFQRCFRDNYAGLGLCAEVLNDFYIPNHFLRVLPLIYQHTQHTHITHIDTH